MLGLIRQKVFVVFFIRGSLHLIPFVKLRRVVGLELADVCCIFAVKLIKILHILAVSLFELVSYII